MDGSKDLASQQLPNGTNSTNAVSLPSYFRRWEGRPGLGVWSGLILTVPSNDGILVIAVAVQGPMDTISSNSRQSSH